MNTSSQRSTHPARRHRRLGSASAITLTCAGLGLASCSSQSVQRYRASDSNPVMAFIEMFQGPSTRELATGAFDGSDADRRRQAVAALSTSDVGGHESTVKIYRILLGSRSGEPVADASPDPDPTVRAVCVRALGVHGVVDDAQVLIPRLQDESAIVRWEAAMALQKIHHEAAVVPLIRSLRGNAAALTLDDLEADEDADVRGAAATALGQYPQPRVYEALVGALLDRDFGVVHAAHQSLITLTGRADLPADPTHWIAFRNAQRNDVFAEARTFVYTPYPTRPGFWDRMRFWEPKEEPQPRVPTGLLSDGA